MNNRAWVYKITINNTKTYTVTQVANFFEAFSSLNVSIDDVKTLNVEAKRRPDAPRFRTMSKEWVQKEISLLKNPSNYISPEQRKAARIKKEEKAWAEVQKEEARNIQKEQQRQKDLNNPNLYKDVVCKRCKGKGYLSHYAYVELGRCFSCSGTGYKKVKIKSA